MAISYPLTFPSWCVPQEAQITHRQIAPSSASIFTAQKKFANYTSQWREMGLRLPTLVVA